MYFVSRTWQTMAMCGYIAIVFKWRTARWQKQFGCRHLTDYSAAEILVINYINGNHSFDEMVDC